MPSLNLIVQTTLTKPSEFIRHFSILFIAPH